MGTEMTEQVRPEVLISRLMAENESWRVDAEMRLVSLGETAVDPLIGALRHASPAVRVHAAHALGQIQNARAIPAMIKALEDTENNSAVAIAAEKALIAWGEPMKGALLQTAFHGSEHVRPRVLRALGRIGGDDLAMPLRTLLADPAPAVRTQAAAALASIMREGAVDLVAPLLDDADKWVRYGVAEVLVKAASCTRGQRVLEAARDDSEEEESGIKFWAQDLLDQIDELKRTGRAIP